jgi:hypothetical protein
VEGRRDIEVDRERENGLQVPEGQCYMNIVFSCGEGWFSEMRI